jgi:hypothetical protein
MNILPVDRALSIYGGLTEFAIRLLAERSEAAARPAGLFGDLA